MAPSPDQECTPCYRAFKTLRACHRALLSSHSQTELLQRVCDSMVGEGGYPLAWAGLKSDRPQGGPAPNAWAGSRLGSFVSQEEGEDPARTGPHSAREAIRTGQPVPGPLNAEDSCGFPASLALPLLEEGRATGALILCAGDPEAFDEPEVDLLQAVADEIAFGLDHLHLLERQRRLTAIVEAAPDMIAFAEPGDPPRPTYLNPGGQALLGVEGSDRTGVEGNGILEAHPQWAAQRLRDEALPRALRDGSWRGETAVLGPDGAEIPVDQTIVAHRDGNGTVTQLSTLVRDIRDHKRAEEALRREALQAESVTQALIDALPGLFFFFGSDGRLHRWNREVERVTGTDADHLLRGQLADFFAEDQHSTLRSVFRRVLDQGAGWTEADLLTPDGPVPYQLQAQRVVLGGWPFVVGIGMDLSERKAAEERNQLTATVFDTAHDALMITDPEGRILEVNPAFTEQTGYTREEALGTDPGELLDSHRHAPGFFGAVFAEVEEWGFWEGTLQNCRKDGSTVVHRETIAKVCDEARRTTHYVATMADITPIKEAEDRARRERELTDAVVDSLPGVFFFLDRQGYNLRSNRKAAEYVGVEPRECREAPGPVLTFFDSSDRPTVRQQIQAGFQGENEGGLEVDLVGRDGGRTPFLFNAKPIRLGEETYLCGLGIDITQRKAMETELRVLACTDPLTGARNRAAFEGNLHERLAESERYGAPFLLAMVDIDHFKAINDRYGHQAGDRILKTLVGILHEQSRDMDTVCRWGGEEFTVLMPRTRLEGGVSWAERVQEALAEPLVPGLPAVSISIGVTAYRDRDTSNSLLQRADSAMYEAKKAGRDRIRSL